MSEAQGKLLQGEMNMTLNMAMMTSARDAVGKCLATLGGEYDNMLVLTDYLRKMGYKIPESYDQNIKDMPKNYKRILKQSYEDVYNANDPLSVTFTQIMDGVEQGTGLDLENILFNTMDILATD